MTDNMLFLIIPVAAICIAALCFYLRSRKIKADTSDLPQGFTYTAHTGCMKTKKNSLESIEAGSVHGASIIEFDLHFLKDGTAVLSHDEPKGGEIPLDEAFEKLREYPHLKINVDVKNTVDLKQVKTLAEKHGILDRIFYTGIKENDVAAVKAATPDIPYYLNIDVLPAKDHTEEYLMSLVEKVKECGAVGINFNKKSASKELVDLFRKNGFLVSIWTVNSKKDIFRILSYCPDNITTKRPDRLSFLLS